ncbi:hypothetical protein OIO90_003583 [Microbotryomycetes sp. JL221]|nr:hypothetical protein OIO90_003583 [Microbotryomycetes sp. JL221]
MHRPGGSRTPQLAVLTLWPKLKYHGAFLLSESRDFWLPPPILRSAITFSELREPKMPIPVTIEKSQEHEKAVAYTSEIQRQGHAVAVNRKPPSYRHLKQNVFVERKAEKVESDAIAMGNRGFGVKTEVGIPAGKFVCDYRGEVISRDEACRPVKHEYKEWSSYYFLNYNGHEVLDAGRKGSISRFVNSSCDPNVKVVSWRMASLNEFQMGIYAMKDIEPGTELVYDYGWTEFYALRDIGGSSSSSSESETDDAAPDAELAATEHSPSTPSKLDRTKLRRKTCRTGSNVGETRREETNNEERPVMQRLDINRGRSAGETAKTLGIRQAEWIKG